MSRNLLFSLTKRDFDISFYRGTGKGGQNRNKVETGVRIVHPESGAIAEACEERSQLQNRHIAFRRLINSPKFKAWHRLKCQAALQDLSVKEMLQQWVDEQMSPGNIRVEVRTSSGWTEVDPERT